MLQLSAKGCLPQHVPVGGSRPLPLPLPTAHHTIIEVPKWPFTWHSMCTRSQPSVCVQQAEAKLMLAKAWCSANSS